MNSVIIIIPYFGPFPTQFIFWLQSAYNNPSINFLVITDNTLISQANIKVIKMTLQELKKFIQSKFDFTIALPSSYKLCDYKGAYGYIFSDYVKYYDFWGFGDIDLVYGNIRHFLTDEILSLHNAILGYGHLTLYRNNEECNTFFKTKIEGFQYYEDAFTNEKNTVFDEYLHGGLSDIWKHKYPNLLWDKRPFDDITVPRLSFNFKSNFNSVASNKLIFEYSEKNLYRIYINSKNEITKEPTLYAHFQLRKFMKVKTNNTEKYLIIPNAYINHTHVTIYKLNRWCRQRNIYRFYWNLKNRIVSRLKIIIQR